MESRPYSVAWWLWREMVYYKELTPQVPIDFVWRLHRPVGWDRGSLELKMGQCMYICSSLSLILLTR
jgi:hypothetical protein